MQGMASVAKATTENNTLLRRMDPASSEIADVQKGMLRLMADLRTMIEARNTVSRNMFSALHEELKGYKDGFLLQTVHRPIIRDLVTLYDDVAELHRQLVNIGPAHTPSSKAKAEVNAMLGRVRQVATNMENNMEFILEVLARLDVTAMPPGPEKLDKLSQKAVSLEAAANQEEDGTIVRVVKRGFLWKDAVLRPEEVVIKKWKQNSAGDASPEAKQ
jgi:GrpE